MERPMPFDDLSKSLVVLDQNSTLISTVELSLSSWLVASLVPGVDRQPQKKLDPDPEALVRLLLRWRDEAVRAGRRIERIALAFEAGRDGFWLARFLKERGIEAYVIHASSIPVKREHRRAKSDRLDNLLLMRSFLGWLRGEENHCSMVAIPTMEEEDAKRPSREHETLVSERTRLINGMRATLIRFGVRSFKPELRKAAERLGGVRTAEGTSLPPLTLAELRHDLERLSLVRAQIKEIETQRLARLAEAPQEGPHPMMAMLAKVRGLGIETADMLVNEVLSRNLRDRKAVARYAGLTGSPDESGRKRREKGLARAGNARVRRGMVQLAWRFLMFQKECALVKWYQARVAAAARRDLRKTLIVALAHRLLVALWRYATQGVVPEGLVFNAAA
jgi:transposase